MQKREKKGLHLKVEVEGRHAHVIDLADGKEIFPVMRLGIRRDGPQDVLVLSMDVMLYSATIEGRTLASAYTDEVFRDTRLSTVEVEGEIPPAAFEMNVPDYTHPIFKLRDLVDWSERMLDPRNDPYSVAMVNGLRLALSIMDGSPLSPLPLHKPLLMEDRDQMEHRLDFLSRTTERFFASAQETIDSLQRLPSTGPVTGAPSKN